MILSEYIIDFVILQFRLEDDNLLNLVNSFTYVSERDPSKKYGV